MTQYYNLIELLNKAKGNRSLNRFALLCGIDAGHLSRVMRGIMVNSPSPDTLKKISEKAYNGVTYEDLMEAAGYIEKKFIGRNIALLRGKMTYEEYSKHLTDKENISLSPWLIERYERGLEQPENVIVEYIAGAEHLNPEFFYQHNNELSMEIMRIKESTQENKPAFMSPEIIEWIHSPENYPYVEFIHKAYKSGISKELLDKAEISININK